MADDLEFMVPVVEGESPSPEFVARLRAQIVAETEAQDAPSTATVDSLIDIRTAASADQKPTDFWWRLIGGVAAAAVLIVGGVVLVTQRDDRRVEPLDQPIETTPPTIISAPAVLVPDAVPLPADASPVDAGTYLVDAMGTPFTFTTEEPLFVERLGSAAVVLAHSNSQIGGDRDIVVMRLTHLIDPGRPIAFPDDDHLDWPADDLDGWYANLNNELIVSGRTETMLGGLGTTRFDLQLGDTECTAADEVCALFATNHSVYAKPLNPGEFYRVWMVDQHGEAPLVFIAGIDREADRMWFETAETLLSTLAFGEVRPNPILAGPSVTAELPFIGGIRINLPEGAHAERTLGGIDRVGLDGWSVDTKFLSDVRDVDGNLLDTSDDVIDALRRQGVDVTELAPTTIGGIEARVVDISASTTGSAQMLTSVDEGGWQLPPAGRIWLIDHPERGLLTITAESYGNIDISLGVVLAETEAIIASLVFVELG